MDYKIRKLAAQAILAPWIPALVEVNDIVFRAVWGDIWTRN